MYICTNVNTYMYGFTLWRDTKDYLDDLCKLTLAFILAHISIFQCNQYNDRPKQAEIVLQHLTLWTVNKTFKQYFVDLVFVHFLFSISISIIFSLLLLLACWYPKAIAFAVDCGEYYPNLTNFWRRGGYSMFTMQYINYELSAY